MAGPMVALRRRARRDEMDRTELGQTGLVGWREKVADGVAAPIATRTPLSDEDARAIVGALFFALSVYYVVGTIVRAVRQTRR